MNRDKSKSLSVTLTPPPLPKKKEKKYFVNNSFAKHFHKMLITILGNFIFISTVKIATCEIEN